METTADQNLQKDVFVAGWGATNERGRDPADALQKLNVPLFPGKNTKSNRLHLVEGMMQQSSCHICRRRPPGALIWNHL